jgi:hypothetical protein
MSNETIRWLMSDSVKPDDSETVLINLSDDEDEPVWLGWWDSSENKWRDVLGTFIRGGVAYWAPMPRGPM